MSTEPADELEQHTAARDDDAIDPFDLIAQGPGRSAAKTLASMQADAAPDNGRTTTSISAVRRQQAEREADRERRASEPQMGRPTCTPTSSRTIACQGSENEVMNWNTPSRNNCPFEYASW